MRGFIKFLLLIAVVGFIGARGPALLFRFLDKANYPFLAHNKLPDLTFAQLGSSTLISLNSCPTPKCLTFVEAPWCPACRADTPLIKSVRDYTNRQNVTTRIIVGNDSVDACRSYAAEYGPDTLLDSRTRFRVPLLPYFIVSDNTGKVLNAGPFYDQHLEVAEVAKKMGIP